MFDSIGREVLRQCDGQDGLRDVSDPMDFNERRTFVLYCRINDLLKHRTGWNFRTLFQIHMDATSMPNPCSAGMSPPGRRQQIV